MLLVCNGLCGEVLELKLIFGVHLIINIFKMGQSIIEIQDLQIYFYFNSLVNATLHGKFLWNSITLSKKIHLSHIHQSTTFYPHPLSSLLFCLILLFHHLNSPSKMCHRKKVTRRKRGKNSKKWWRRISFCSKKWKNIHRSRKWNWIQHKKECSHSNYRIYKNLLDSFRWQSQKKMSKNEEFF